MCISTMPTLQAINQHPYENRGCLLNDDVSNLGEVIRATKTTLFCIDKEAVWPTRIWCDAKAMITVPFTGLIHPSALLVNIIPCWRLQ